MLFHFHFFLFINITAAYPQAAKNRYGQFSNNKNVDD